MVMGSPSDSGTMGDQSKCCWAVVSGGIEADGSESPLLRAHTEILEETGIERSMLTLRRRGRPFVLEDRRYRWHLHPFHFLVSRRARVDINWEQHTTGATTAQAVRFFRILRQRLDQYLTTPQGKGAVGGKPWLSVTGPPGHFQFWSTAIDPYITIYVVQQGVVQWQSNGVWFDWAIWRGPSPPPSGCDGTGAWLVAMADWWNVPAGHNNLGMNYLLYLGFNKAKIAPASTIGGGTLFRGVDGPYQCHNWNVAFDVFRGGNRWDGGNNEADFLAKGGTRVYDPVYGVLDALNVLG